MWTYLIIFPSPLLYQELSFLIICSGLYPFLDIYPPFYEIIIGIVFRRHVNIPTAAMAIENAKLNESVVNGYKNTVVSLAGAIDAKDPYTRGHSERVMEYTLLGGISLALSTKEMDILEYAAILHDLGKIGIADNILSKPGVLTSDEELAINQHPLIGAKIIEGVPFLQEARKLILYHHEKFDGTGYPDGLKGEEIPIGARLIAVADTFDTMTTDRAYRAAQSINNTLDELYRYSGTQFCPVAVKAFVSSFRMNADSPSTLQL